MLIHWSASAWTWPLLLVLAAGAIVSTVVIYRRTSPIPPSGVATALVWLRSAALICLIAAVGAPFLAMTRMREEAAELLVLLEDSASMGITDVGDSLSGPMVSRWERARAIAQQLEGLSTSGQGEFQPVFLRGNGLSNPETWRPDDIVTMPPREQGTDLAALMRRSLKSRQGRPVEAVVLISDGCQSSPETVPGNPAATTGRSILPPDRFFSIGVGDPVGPRDRLLSDVRYPKIVHKGDRVQVDGVVQQRFITPAPTDSMTVTLRGPRGLLASVRLATSADAVPFSLTFVPDQEGMQVYPLAVSALDNERFPANNQVSLGISVRKERARLLMLSLAPRWDARFLAQAASAEPRLEMQVVYPGPAGLVLADSLAPWRIPGTAGEWARFDGVVLEFSSLPDSLWRIGGKSLLEAVKAGMGLLVLPGPGFKGMAGAMTPPVPEDLRAALPVRYDAWQWRPGEYFLDPVVGARGHPVLDGVLNEASSSPTGEFGQGGLSFVPPQRAILAVKAGDDAQVLLQGRSRGHSALPALVLGKRDQGRIAWFGGNALWVTAFWEKGYDEGTTSADQAGRRLLRNLLVWLGIGEDAGGLHFQGDLPLAKSGQPLNLSGIWQDIRGGQVTEGRVVLRVETLPKVDQPPTDRSEVRTYEAGSLDPQTGEFDIPVPPLAPGRYALTLLGSGGVESPPSVLVVDASSPEDVQVRQDSRSLVQLANRYDGRYIAASDSSGMTGLMADLAGLPWQGRRLPLRSRYDVTAGLPFLGLVVVLLGCEWYLRRRHGLL